MKHLMNVSVAVLLVFAAIDVIAHEGATGVVKQRMDRFKASKDSVDVIKDALKEADWVGLTTESESLLRWAQEMDQYFPEGSQQKPSEARDAVWADWDGFTEAIEAYQGTTRRLVDAVTANSVTDTSKAFKAMLRSCKSCHNEYRKD